MLEVATDAGLPQRPAIGVLQVAVNAVCPAERDRANQELSDANVQF